jgi:hypothetical protein
LSGRAELTAPVRPRDDFEQVPIRIFEVHPAPAVIAVDLTGPRLTWIRPVFEPTVADAAKDDVELVLAG